MEIVQIKDNEGASPVSLCQRDTLNQIPNFAKHYLENTTTTTTVFCGQTFNSVFAQRFMNKTPI